MNENKEKSRLFPTDEKTVVINSNDIEKTLLSEAETVVETRQRDDLDLAIDRILKEDFSAGLPELDLREEEEFKVYIPSREPEPERKKPETSEKAQRIIAEKADEQKHNKKKRWIFVCIAAAVVLALALVLVLLLKNSSHKQDYSKPFNEAQLSYYDGDYDEALSLLREAMSVEKTDDCLILMSQCYEAKGDYDNAISILESSNTGSELIQKRIEKMKAAKEEFEQGKTVVVCGEQYDVSETTLDLCNQQLRSGRLQELSLLPELTSLRLSDNEITDIGFLSPLTKLVSLDLSNNYISELSPLSGLTELRTLSLDNNADIKDFTPLYKLHSLTKLSISGIKISESTLNELKNNLPGCLIASDEAGADVVEITLGGKTFKSDVTKLDLSDREIVDISALSACTKLTELDLSGNYIRDISPLLDIPELVVLNLSENSITDIRPLMSMTTLEHLSLGGNDISSITALSGLSALKELVLNGNPISGTQSLSGLKALRILGLKNTGIKDSDLLYLYSLKKLEKLSLEGNTLLSEKTVNELKSKLPSCTVSCSELIKSIILGDKEFGAYDETVEANELGISDISGVEEFKDIKNLDLSGNIITDITPLSKLSTLESLDLCDNNISDVTALYALHELRQLWLSKNSLSDEQIEELREALPDCTIIVE